MDFSANLHHQLLQLENQLLLGSGSSHAWTPDISLSPSCDFEPNCHFQDLNPAIDIAESNNETLNNHYYCSFEEEDLNKIAQSCCCSKIHPTVNVSSRKPLMAELSSSDHLGFDHHTLSFASSHHLLQQPRTSSLLTNIRKEKLGDRIAGLQQLVSPFGKTDTASVLMEAISYINFLQTQIEMLSHSYMKSCRSKNYKTICRDELNEKDKKSESDLKAKGLCLVPLTCISYLPEDISNGGRIGSIWPPLTAANFNRRTF